MKKSLILILFLSCNILHAGTSSFSLFPKTKNGLLFGGGASLRRGSILQPYVSTRLVLEVIGVDLRVGESVGDSFEPSYYGFFRLASFFYGVGKGPLGEFSTMGLSSAPYDTRGGPFGKGGGITIDVTRYYSNPGDFTVKFGVLFWFN